MKNVIVMGGNYSLTLGVTRSLGEAGFNVKLFVADKWTERIAGKSKYVIKCCNCMEVSEDKKSSSFLKLFHKLTSIVLRKPELKKEIEFERVWSTLEKLRDNDEHILIIPVSDPYCLMLDEHARAFLEHYYIPNCFEKPGKVTYYMDKMIQKDLAKQCGLKTAWGNVYSTDKYGIQRAVQEVKIPCFMKVLLSANVFKGKSLYAVCKNKEELKTAMKNALDNGCSKVMVEEYLEIEKDVCVYGVAGNNQVFMPGCLETLRGGNGRHRGVTIEGVFVSTKQLGEIKLKLENFVKKSGLTGLFCIDLIQSKGTIYFTEMNLRSGASIYGVTLAGSNLPATLANMVYHKSYERPNDIKRRAHFLSEMIELDTYIDGFISRKEYLKHMESAHDRFIRNEVDSAPWKEFQKLEFRNQIVKYVRLCKKLLK